MLGRPSIRDLGCGQSDCGLTDPVAARLTMTGSSNRLTGGCQCGALRYEWLEKPTHSSVCYCRMCQKASGQPFMALTGGERENLRWTRGTLSIFKSSNMVERGFCRDCGTPLTYSFVSA